MKKLLLLFVLVTGTLAVHAADLEWNVSDWTGYSNGDTIVGKSDNLSVTIDGLTLYSDEGYYLTYATGSKTVGDVTYTARVKTNGAGKTTRRAMKFVVDGPCEIAATIAHGSSSGDARSLIVYDSIQATQIGTISAEANATVCDTVTYSGDGTTIILYSDANIGIYDIQVTYSNIVSGDNSAYIESDTLLTYTCSSGTTIGSTLQAGNGTIYFNTGSTTDASSYGEGYYSYKIDVDFPEKYVLLKLAENETLQAGDVISLTGYETAGTPSSSKVIAFNIYSGLDKSGADSLTHLTFTAKSTLETMTYTVSEGDGLVGLDSLCIGRSTNYSVYLIAAIITRSTTITDIERATIDEWATFSSSSNVTYDTESVTAYTAKVVTEESTTYIQLTEYEGDVLPANTGFVLHSTGESITLTLTDETTTGVDDNDLIPTCETVFTVTESKTYYGLGSDATFYPIAVGGTAPANRAYLKIDSSSSDAIAMSIIDSDAEEDVTNDTTGISSVKNSATQQDGVYYNLQGMRVSEPASGIYIVNGKKVIIK